MLWLDDVVHLAPHLPLELRNVIRVRLIPKAQWRECLFPKSSTVSLRCFGDLQWRGKLLTLRVVTSQFLLRSCLVVVGEVTQEEEGQHVVAEVIRIHGSAQLVRDAPEGVAQLFLFLFGHVVDVGVGGKWVGPSALKTFVAAVLGRCPRLVWRCAVGAEASLGRCPRLVWRCAVGAEERMRLVGAEERMRLVGAEASLGRCPRLVWRCAVGAEERERIVGAEERMRLGRSLVVWILRAKGPSSYQPRATPWVAGNKPDQGPTARPIQAGRLCGCCELVPDIAFVVFDSVFLEEVAVFVLESSRSVVFLLGVDVMQQGVDIRWPDGKGTVTALPRKGGQCRGLGFEPFGGRRFQFLDELGHGDRP